jgi:hypothetical protein
MAFNTDMTLMDWASEYGLTTPVINDNQASMNAFGGTGFPSVFLFGPGHVLLYKGRNWEPELEKALAGE